MALHPGLPTSPNALLPPAQRWFPADESLRERSYEKLLPPLVAHIRREVQAWRDAGYAGASATSQTLPRWWFDTEQRYGFVYVDKGGFEQHKPQTFANPVTGLRQYQEAA